MNTETELNARDTWNDRVEKSCVLHWDGRLDNRTDLLLLLADLLRDDNSNAAIALATYERWGTHGFVHLLGDCVIYICKIDGCIKKASPAAGTLNLSTTGVSAISCFAE